MDTDDLEPRTPPLGSAGRKPKDLDLLGVEELQDYLSDLETEAERVRAKIASKTDYQSTAASLFKR